MSFIGVIMLMGLVAKNAILLLDCAREEEAQGVDREEALMHAGRERLRPDPDDHLRADRRHDAGGDRRRRRRRVLPPDGGGDHRRHDHLDACSRCWWSRRFYDSIEIWRDRAVAKYRRREQRWHAAPAFVMTLLEAIATALMFAFPVARRSWLLARTFRRTQPA